MLHNLLKETKAAQHKRKDSIGPEVDYPSSHNEHLLNNQSPRRSMSHSASPTELNDHRTTMNVLEIIIGTKEKDRLITANNITDSDTTANLDNESLPTKKDIFTNIDLISDRLANYHPSYVSSWGGSADSKQSIATKINDSNILSDLKSSILLIKASVKTSCIESGKRCTQLEKKLTLYFEENEQLQQQIENQFETINSHLTKLKKFIQDANNSPAKDWEGKICLFRNVANSFPKILQDIKQLSKDVESIVKIGDHLASNINYKYMAAEDKSDAFLTIDTIRRNQEI
jgi:hypothetical protein